SRHERLGCRDQSGLAWSSLLGATLDGPVLFIENQGIRLLKLSAAKSSARLLNPTQLFLKAEAVIIVALLDNFAVLDAHEGQPVEAEWLAGRRRVRSPCAGVGAGEGPLKSDAIRAFDRLAAHLPRQIGRRRHEQLDDLVTRRITSFLRLAGGDVEISDIIGHECSGGVRVV